MKCDLYEHGKKTCGKIYMKSASSQPVATAGRAERVHIDVVECGESMLIHVNLMREKINCCGC